MDYQEEECNDDKLLIKSVRSYPNIFDKRHSLFKDKVARAKAWRAIAYSLHKKSEECEQRWVVLRHRYVSEIRKMREDPSIKKSAWLLYSSMGFLDIFITPRKSSWNSKRAPHEESSASNAESEIKLQEIEIKNEEVEYEVVDSPSTPTTIEPSNDVFDGSQGEGSFVRVKQDEERLTLSVATALGELKGCLQRVESDQRETCDPDFSFGKTVALHLKEIESRKRKRHVKLEIMKILLRDDSDDESK